VRFEADGYLEEELGEEGVKEDVSGFTKHETHTPRGSAATLAIDGIDVRNKGKLIPQHAIFELHTRSCNKRDEDHLSDTLPRLWLAQIPFSILAFHSRGVFEPEDITVTDVREAIEEWETVNQELLRRLQTRTLASTRSAVNSRAFWRSASRVAKFLRLWPAR
jgi:hypothetical protein